MGVAIQVAVKLCADGPFWQREKEVYTNRMTLDPGSAADFMPEVFEVLQGLQSTKTGEPIPPGLVMEAGEFTLEVSFCLIQPWSYLRAELAV